MATVPEVSAVIGVTPAKRRASFVVPLSDAVKASAKVNAKEVHLTATPYQGIYVPRTLDAVDGLTALLAAVRAELIEQGVES